MAGGEARDAVRVGDTIGKYRLVRFLGEGGMAVVFEAEHERLGQRVAIKFLKRECAADATIVERFEREGRAIGKLRSPHVVRVMDVDVTAGGQPYLVMEFLEGRDLEQELVARGPLPVAEACGYLLQACRGLGEAHARGMVHRDVKPTNLFLTFENGVAMVKVLDFGIARDVPGSEARLTQTQALMGTPIYMAPEQYRSARDVDARADVWALGASLYELLCGDPPFAGTIATVGVSILMDDLPPITERRADLPASLVDVIGKALAKNKDERYATAAELGAALMEFADRVVVAPISSTGAMLMVREGEGAATLPAMIAKTAVSEGFSPQAERKAWVLARAPAFAFLAVGGIVAALVAPLLVRTSHAPPAGVANATGDAANAAIPAANGTAAVANATLVTPTRPVANATAATAAVANAMAQDAAVAGATVANATPPAQAAPASSPGFRASASASSGPRPSSARPLPSPSQGSPKPAPPDAPLFFPTEK